MEYKLKIGVGLLAVVLLCSCFNTKQTTFVLVPDTQYYAEKYPEILHSQVDWIAENADGIDMVLHEGDLTQNNSREEWEVVKSGYYKLNGVVPYVLAVGNHDMGSEPGKFADKRNTELFNSFFPYREMSELPAFAGAFEPGKMDNVYYLFEKSNQKWMILSLEFGPRNEVLNWAGEIASEYPDRIVILNTHSYMYSDSTRQGPGDNWRPQNYGIGKDTGAEAVNDGEDIWNKLVKTSPNIRFVFSGHVLNSGVGTLISLNDEGYPVYQMLANYQSGVKGAEKGGNGYLRILVYNNRENTLSVKTYSPYLDKYMETPDQEFIIRSVSLIN